MSLKCGIIGITNTGKTTILNCVSNTKAEATSFAFSTNKSNVGVINVPDPRLDKINSFVSSKKVTPATVDIVDIPGLAKGSSEGEGVGNQFLADIQQTNALIHVLRCFDDENLPHVEGSIDPVRDMEIIDLAPRQRAGETLLTVGGNGGGGDAQLVEAERAGAGLPPAAGLRNRGRRSSWNKASVRSRGRTSWPPMRMARLEKYPVSRSMRIRST